MGELENRGGKHGRYTRIHGVAALVVEAHARFGGGLAARGHRAAYATRGLPHRAIERLFALRVAQDREAEEQHPSFGFHETAYILQPGMRTPLPHGRGSEIRN